MEAESLSLRTMIQQQ